MVHKRLLLSLLCWLTADENFVSIKPDITFHCKSFCANFTISFIIITEFKIYRYFRDNHGKKIAKSFLSLIKFQVFFSRQWNLVQSTSKTEASKDKSAPILLILFAISNSSLCLNSFDLSFHKSSSRRWKSYRSSFTEKFQLSRRWHNFLIRLH